MDSDPRLQSALHNASNARISKRRKGSKVKMSSVPQPTWSTMESSLFQVHEADLQRKSIACSHCRRTKLKCVDAEGDDLGRCKNCIRLKKECVFYSFDSTGDSEGRTPVLPQRIVRQAVKDIALRKKAQPQHANQLPPRQNSDIIAHPPSVWRDQRVVAVPRVVAEYKMLSSSYSDVEHRGETTGKHRDQRHTSHEKSTWRAGVIAQDHSGTGPPPKNITGILSQEQHQLMLRTGLQQAGLTPEQTEKLMMQDSELQQRLSPEAYARMQHRLQAQKIKVKQPRSREKNTRRADVMAQKPEERSHDDIIIYDRSGLGASGMPNRRYTNRKLASIKAPVPSPSRVLPGSRKRLVDYTVSDDWTDNSARKKLRLCALQGLSIEAEFSLSL